MANKIIIFSGKQYSGKDTAGKILIDAMPSFKRCAMGDIIKLEYGRLNNLSFEEIDLSEAKSVGEIEIHTEDVDVRNKKVNIIPGENITVQK